MLLEFNTCEIYFLADEKVGARSQLAIFALVSNKTKSTLFFVLKM